MQSIFIKSSFFIDFFQAFQLFAAFNFKILQKIPPATNFSTVAGVCFLATPIKKIVLNLLQPKIDFQLIILLQTFYFQ